MLDNETLEKVETIVERTITAKSDPGITVFRLGFGPCKAKHSVFATYGANGMPRTEWMTSLLRKRETSLGHPNGVLPLSGLVSGPECFAYSIAWTDENTATPELIEQELLTAIETLRTAA